MPVLWHSVKPSLLKHLAMSAMKTDQSELLLELLEFVEMGTLLKRLRDPESTLDSLMPDSCSGIADPDRCQAGNVCANALGCMSILEGDQPTWVIPAKLMKKRRDHIVPLSSQGVQLLQTIS